MSAKADLVARQKDRWPRILGRIEAAKTPARLTREELAEMVVTAKRLDLTHVQIQIPRSKPPAARMWLDGGSSPWSDHTRGVSKVRAGLWAAWWSVDEVAAWLAGSS